MMWKGKERDGKGKGNERDRRREERNRRGEGKDIERERKGKRRRGKRKAKESKEPESRGCASTCCTCGFAGFTQAREHSSPNFVYLAESISATATMVNGAIYWPSHCLIYLPDGAFIVDHSPCNADAYTVIS